MLQKTALVVICFVALVCGQSVTPDPNYNAAGYWRGYNCSTNGQTAAAFGAAYAVGTSPKGGAAAIDAVLATMSTPKQTNTNTTSGSFNFYFAYLFAAADWNKQTDVVHIAAAGAELISAMYSLYCWYDQDNNPGFQYDLTQGPCYCNDSLITPNKVQDCVDEGSKVDLSTLSWNAVTQQSSSCPSNYEADCTIVTFTASDTSNIITFTLQVSSQPVFVNLVSLKPDYGKITLTINYPWTSMQSKIINPSQARVLLLAGTAGRAGAGAAAFSTNVDGDKALAWAVGGKVAYFNWAGVAQVKSPNNDNSVVYIQAVTDTQIKNQPLPTFFSKQYGVLLWLQIVVGLWSAFGYGTTLQFFSWNDIQPQTIIWDPKVGVSSDSGAFFLASNPAILLIALCLLFIYQRRQ